MIFYLFIGMCVKTNIYFNELLFIFSQTLFSFVGTVFF